MSSGVLSLIALFVMSILYVTGWGTRYEKESGLPAKRWVWLFIGIGLTRSLTVSFGEVQIQITILMIGILLLVYGVKLPSVRDRFQFLLALLSCASLSFALMVIVPHEPAFYVLHENYLYPISALLAAYLFSRKPLFTLNVSIAGILLAGMVYENRLSIMSAGALSLGSVDLLDLAASVLLLAFLVDHMIAAVEGVFIRTHQQQKSKLEGDPT